MGIWGSKQHSVRRLRRRLAWTRSVVGFLAEQVQVKLKMSSFAKQQAKTRILMERTC